MAPTKKDLPINNNEFQYIVGIDFGTTHSGAGYMFIQNAEQKEVIDINWPNNKKSSSLKIPTVIRYHKKDRSIYKCGLEAISISKREIDEYDCCIHLFKLYLSETARPVLSELPKGLDIVAVISDYLRYLHKNIRIDIQKTLGSDDAGLEKKLASFRYCLTVPTRWTDDAKLKMREACILAGIIDRNDHVDRLLIVGEPEAAALYCEQIKNGISIRSGERLMIVDAGGKTIDLITFEKTIDNETKSFKGIVDSDGNSSGSSRLDLEFREFIIRNTYCFDLDDESLDQLVETFKTDTKISIDPKAPDGPVYIKLPNSLRGRTIENDNGFKMDIEILSIPKHLLLAEVFDPVIDEIIHIIGYHINVLDRNLLHYIILVGGFSQSPYLLQRIRDKYSNEEKVGSIVVPDVGELAVTRGAVFFGLKPYSISHRRMKASYGVSISSPFIHDKDKPEYKIFDKDGIAYCKNRFDLLVRKGEDVSVRDCVSRRYTTQNSDTFFIKLYSYSGNVIPRYVAVNDDDAEDTAKMVAGFAVPIPLSQGQETSFKMDIYFGQIEIKIEVTLDGSKNKRAFTASYFQNK